MSTTDTQPRRRLRPGLLLAVASTVGLLLLVGARYKEAVAERAAFAASAPAAKRAPSSGAAALATAHGQEARWQPRVELTGTLSPLHESSVGFKVTGRLAAVLAKVGDRVKAGQRLARLDPAEAKAQLAAANAQVHAAEVELAIARDNAQRSQALLAQGAISETQHLGDSQRAELAQARLEQARAQTQTASTALHNTELLAPFAGLVTQAPSAPGAIVTPASPLFRLEDTSSLRLEASVSADEAALLRVGQPVQLESGRSGHITALLPSVDQKTRRVPLLAQIDNRGPDPLLAGVLVRAHVIAGEPRSVLRLPASALRPGSQDEVVLARGGKAQLQHVVFARAADGSLLVRAGLSAGDQVLLAPSAEVHDGDALGSASAGAPPPR